MPRNVWSAGQDALLGFLAERDAMNRLDEDRARRDRLDAENAADRQRGREIQDAQLRSIDEDRDERRRMAGDVAKAKQAEAAAAAARTAQMGELLDAYDAAKTPEEKQAIGTRILTAGGKLAPEPRAKPRDPLADYEAKKKIDQKYAKPEAGAKGPKDDPRLPMGTKKWIESISQRGATIEDARTELSRGWQQQLAAHPNADLAQASLFLNRLYPNGQPLGTAPETPVVPETEHRNTHPDINLSAPGAASVPEAASAPSQKVDQAEVEQTAYALVSNELQKAATPEQVQRFLSDPNNLAEVQKMVAAGRR